jgi:hypothetical protein
MAELTKLEQEFFATGKLPEELATTIDPIALAGVGDSAAPSPAPPPEPTSPPVAPPAADPTQNNEALEILRRSLAEAQQRVGQLEQHIQSTQVAQAPAPAPAPDPVTDPLGAMMHQLKTVNEQVSTLQQQILDQQNAQTSTVNFQQFQAQVHNLRNEFAKTHADFDDAYTHFRSSRVADLRALGFNDQRINQAVFQEEAILAQNAVMNGRNPAEVVYEMAKRHGYAPKTTTGTPTSPDAKLAAIEQAQNAAKNLPRSPQPPEDLTTEGLKGASDADLNKLVLDPKMWAKIVGSDQYPL